MTDISKCTGINCKLKDLCYRFTAKQNEFRQSYFAETPIDKNGNCQMFWQNKGYDL